MEVLWRRFVISRFRGYPREETLNMSKLQTNYKLSNTISTLKMKMGGGAGDIVLQPK